MSLKQSSELLAYLAETDAERRALIAAVETLSPEELCSKPKPDMWSPLEIVEHLVLGEYDVLQGLPDPDNMTEHKRNLSTPIAYRAVLFVLKYHVSVPVPSTAMLPKGNTSLETLKAEWERSSCWQGDYLRSRNPQDLSRPVFAHPITGGLDIAEVLVMGRLHLQTHARQIRRRLLTLPRAIG